MQALLTAAGFCGVPGQACGTKITDNTDDTELVNADVTEPEHPEIIAMAELQERDELLEREAKKKKKKWSSSHAWWIGTFDIACMNAMEETDKRRILRRPRTGLW